MDLSVKPRQVVEFANVIRDAVKQAGGPRRIGKRLGLTGPAISYWSRVCCVPLEYLPFLAQHSSYTVLQLLEAIAEYHPQYKALAAHIGPRKPRPKPKPKQPTNGERPIYPGGPLARDLRQIPIPEVQ